MKLRNLFILGMCALTTGAFAQIEVKSDDQVIIGGDVITSNAKNTLWVKSSLVQAPGGGMGGY